MTYDEAQIKDERISEEDPYSVIDMPIAKCRCGGEPTIDVSMRLICCAKCGLSFEYRYNRGVIPYHTWQKAAGAIS